MAFAKHHNIRMVTPLIRTDGDGWQPRLVERTCAANGNIVEVFEVGGELIVVESWNVEDTQH